MAKGNINVDRGDDKYDDDDHDDYDEDYNDEDDVSSDSVSEEDYEASGSDYERASADEYYGGHDDEEHDDIQSAAMPQDKPKKSSKVVKVDQNSRNEAVARRPDQGEIADNSEHDGSRERNQEASYSPPRKRTSIPPPDELKKNNQQQPERQQQESTSGPSLSLPPNESGDSYHFSQSSDGPHSPVKTGNTNSNRLLHHENGTTSPPPVPLSPKKRNAENTNGNNDNNNAEGDTNSNIRRKSSHRKSTTTSSNPRISWKADPRASFSDWTIKIMYQDEMDMYHIHRNIVGYGPRKSDYLLNEFRQQEQPVGKGSEEIKNNTTTLHLSLARAKVFPMVLDFMYYTKEVKQTLTAERACHVFKLAELLEIPALLKAIADFYMKNLSLKNMGEFMIAAGQTKADRLLLVCKAKIGQLITEKPELSGLVPPKFLKDILLISRKQLYEAREREPDKYTEDLVESQSKYWSKAACICAVQNQDILTKELFDDLTSEECLPHIDVTVAPQLLSMDAKFRQNSDGSSTSLQRRCIDSITDDFQTFQKAFSSPEAVSDTLRDLPSHVLADILVKSMNK